MEDITRILIFIVIVGLLIGLYKYQEYESEKKYYTNKKQKSKIKNRVDDPIEDSQTLGFLVDAESYQSYDSGNSSDSLFG